MSFSKNERRFTLPRKLEMFNSRNLIEFFSCTFFIKRHLKKRFCNSHVEFLCKMFNQFVQKFIRNFNFKITVNNEVFFWKNE